MTALIIPPGTPTSGNRFNSIQSKGGCTMTSIYGEPQITPRSAFTILGIEARINTGTADYGKIRREFESRRKEIDSFSMASGTYGVYYKSYPPDKVGYIIGIEVGEVSEVPEGFQLLEIPAALYAVFGTSEVPAKEVPWGYIHGDWLPNSKLYRLGNTPVFEYYEGQPMVSVYVCLDRKDT
jgi:predicted transcriptional regulator YdeE